MKRTQKIFIILVMHLFSYAANAQDPGKIAGASCSCGPGQSTCSSVCFFSDCCICWNPATQNGACGCYWGISTCKSGLINPSKGLTLDENIFGEVDPAANIVFHFANFKKLTVFFARLNINTSGFDDVVRSTSSKYISTNDNAKISTADFTALLTAYSKLIVQLTETQKNDLNIYIKTL